MDDNERLARDHAGMPEGHPEKILTKPGRVEWKHLSHWAAEMWPRDEYSKIIAEEGD